MPKQMENSAIDIPSLKGKINNMANYIYTIEENTNQKSFLSDQEIQHQLQSQQKLSQLSPYEEGIQLTFT